MSKTSQRKRDIGQLGFQHGLDGKAYSYKSTNGSLVRCYKAGYRKGQLERKRRRDFIPFLPPENL